MSYLINSSLLKNNNMIMLTGTWCAVAAVAVVAGGWNIAEVMCNKIYYVICPSTKNLNQCNAN